jgi:hypothetical protein
MSKTSCVRHPANARFLKIYQWQLDFCDGNACAAALLSYFGFCHNGKLQQLPQAKVLNDALEQTPEGRSQAETLLQWHTTAELEEAVLFYKRDKIAAAIKLLKSKEVIDVTNNPNPKLWFDRTQYFLFKPAKVNAWIDEHFPTDPDSIVDKSEMPEETRSEDPLSPGIVDKSEMQVREIGSGLRKIDDGARRLVNVLEPRILPKNTDKETKTKARTLAKGISPAEQTSSSFSVEVVEEGASKEKTVEDLAVEFEASKKQFQALTEYVANRGPAAAVSLAEYARPFPKKNRIARFWAGVRDDYTPPEKVTAPEPKAKALVEPDGWQDAYRRLALARYGIEHPELPSYWKNVPRSVQAEVLAEIDRMASVVQPSVQSPVVDFRLARTAVQNAGKTLKEKG